MSNEVHNVIGGAGKTVKVPNQGMDEVPDIWQDGAVYVKRMAAKIARRLPKMRKL